MPKHTTGENNATKEEGLTTKDTPPPSHFSSRVELTTETTTGKEVEVSQQLFNTYSTTIQQLEIVDFNENALIADEAKNTETQEFIQHTT